MTAPFQVSVSGSGMESFVVGPYFVNALRVVVPSLGPGGLPVPDPLSLHIALSCDGGSEREGGREGGSEGGYTLSLAIHDHGLSSCAAPGGGLSLYVHTSRQGAEDSWCTVHTVGYSVGDPAVKAVHLQLSLPGISGTVIRYSPALAPWEPGNPRGRLVQSHRIPGRSFSVCASPDEALVVISLHDLHCLVVLDSATGLEVQCIGTLGSPGDGPGALCQPACVCVVPTQGSLGAVPGAIPGATPGAAPGSCSSGGHVLVADHGNNRVQRLTLEGTHVMTIGAGVLAGPWGVAANDEVIAVGELTTCRIALFSTKDGSPLRVFGAPGVAAGRLCQPRGLRILRDNRHVVVAEEGANRLSQFTLKGRYVKHIGQEVLVRPQDVDLEPRGGGGGGGGGAGVGVGVLLVPDSGNGRVCRFKEGRFLAAWSTAVASTSATPSAPSSTAFARGKLFVVDSKQPLCLVFV
jgi:hypothetical protein